MLQGIFFLQKSMYKRLLQESEFLNVTDNSRLSRETLNEIKIWVTPRRQPGITRYHLIYLTELYHFFKMKDTRHKKKWYFHMIVNLVINLDCCYIFLWMPTGIIKYNLKSGVSLLRVNEVTWPATATEFHTLSHPQVTYKKPVRIPGFGGE